MLKMVIPTVLKNEIKSFIVIFELCSFFVKKLFSVYINLQPRKLFARRNFLCQTSWSSHTHIVKDTVELQWLEH